MTVTAWTQDVAFELTERRAVSFEEAMSLVRSFDWDEQCRRLNDAAQESDGPCPPGVGFSEGKNMFHLFCFSAGEFAIRVEVAREKLWGFVPRPLFSAIFTIPNRNEAEDLLRAFFQPDYERLMQEARQRPAFVGSGMPFAV